MDKIRIGVKNPGAFFPNIGVLVIPVSDKTGNALIEAFKAAKLLLVTKNEVVWAERLVCEWR
jgi:hypothetical protein